MDTNESGFEKRKEKKENKEAWKKGMQGSLLKYVKTKFYFPNECLHFKSFVSTSIEIGSLETKNLEWKRSFLETRKPNHLD